MKAMYYLEQRLSPIDPKLPIHPSYIVKAGWLPVTFGLWAIRGSALGLHATVTSPGGRRFNIHANKTSLIHEKETKGKSKKENNAKATSILTHDTLFLVTANHARSVTCLER